MFDGEAVDDPQTERLWMISQVCEGYSCLPLAAADELDRDPERMALLILDLRGYAAAKSAFDRAKDKVTDLKGWDGNPYMTLVETNTFELRQARLKTTNG